MGAGISEVVTVGVVFRNGLVSPRWISWREKKIEVKRVLMSYERHEGTAVVACFSLQSDTAVCELGWNRETNVWRILSMEVR